MPGLRMAKAPKEHIDRLRIWLQFHNELCQIDPTSEYGWKRLKEDWEEDEEFGAIIKHCEDEDKNFSWEYYMDYFERHISHIHVRIIMGFEVLVDNCCDPNLDYLDFKPEMKKAFEAYTKK